MRLESTQISIALVVLLGSAVACATTHPASALLSRSRAEHIALGRVHDGTIKSAELETEKHRKVWSFDIARPGKAGITEVLVDVHSGQIVSVTTETPKQERAEKKAEAKETARH
ncbi:PepSY domain-containing protein [Cognatilysobacter terrigena]|uniref:PepSY domain-containing protein n=1 Tax=Cognatilysobacter terrigena TaxID=2488749 RepID=UPI00106185A0|nr:PepSY domain-containing protein [Lysobacter terrigena]